MTVRIKALKAVLLILVRITDYHQFTFKVNFVSKLKASLTYTILTLDLDLF